MNSYDFSFVFTDRHAYYPWANFYTDLTNLVHVDWPILQQRDFMRDQNDPEKFERYQAEALIHQRCPITSLLGILCYTVELKSEIEKRINARKLDLKVYFRPEWYFE